jgi:Mor family transcriptional regulator
MDPIEDLSDLQEEIKKKYNLSCGSVFIQLFNEQNRLIDDLDDIPPNYHEKNGPSLLIRIASSGKLNLIDSCV